MCQSKRRTFCGKSTKESHYGKVEISNRYNKNRTEENERGFKKQRSRCIKLLLETKRNYYQNLNLKGLGDSRKVWKVVKLVFSGGIQRPSNVTLPEDDKVIPFDKDVTGIFNDYFVNIIGSIDIVKDDLNLFSTYDIDYSVDIPVTEFSLYPSVKRIKEDFNHSQMFEFTPMSVEDVNNQLHRLDP